MVGRRVEGFGKYLEGSDSSDGQQTYKIINVIVIRNSDILIDIE